MSHATRIRLEGSLRPRKFMVSEVVLALEKVAVVAVVQVVWRRRWLVGRWVGGKTQNKYTVEVKILRSGRTAEPCSRAVQPSRAAEPRSRAVQPSRAAEPYSQVAQLSPHE